jgi:beta-lactamase superfamily II metal-dependent hydrolase
MAETRFIDDDFVALRRSKDRSETPFLTLAFGDAVELLDITDPDWTRVRALSVFDGTATGFIRGRPPLREQGILKLSMVDVQQGDGMVLETPGGRIVLIDGGDNVLFARHVAERFRHRASSPEHPLEVEAIIITHGDADHFEGLNLLRESEDLPEHKALKRVFLHPRRVFHNGLVKGPSNLPDRDIFGRTVVRDGSRLIVDLREDPRDAPQSLQNKHFKRWVDTLNHWQQRGPITLRRLAHGMDEALLFGFLQEEGLGIEIQGPFATEVEVDGQLRPALPFFHVPKKSAEMHLEAPTDTSGTISEAHTINGHSVAMRLTFGNVRFSLTGDLNRESMALMRQRLPLTAFEAEILKTAHHGSHDFDLATLRAIAPVVAIVSSGDENVGKEHIHPRATLMAALGKVMRGDTGIIFCTELAAFFATADECLRRTDLAEFFRQHADQTFTGEQVRQLFTGIPRSDDPKGIFFGFERLNFGIVHVRTDGERVLAFTHSGKKGLNEAYRFTVTRDGAERRIAFAAEVTTR